jgi:hypothetical protein
LVLCIYYARTINGLQCCCRQTNPRGHRARSAEACQQGRGIATVRRAARIGRSEHSAVDRLQARLPARCGAVLAAALGQVDAADRHRLPEARGQAMIAATMARLSASRREQAGASVYDNMIRWRLIRQPGGE